MTPLTTSASSFRLSNMEFTFGEWTADSHILRPVLILLCGMLLFNLPTLIYKIRLTFKGILYLVLCNDKSWKKPQDPNKVFSAIMGKEGINIEKKTIYFVRHGESTWNDTFNKGKHRSAMAFAIGFVPGLVKSMLYEAYLVLSGKMDSWFFDSPLSYLGLGQVDELAVFLRKTPYVDEDLVAILRADPGAPSSQILCSNLRRAISTMAAGFRDRFARRPDDKILIVPSLQEISRNPDTLSITPAHTPVAASWIDRTSKMCDFQGIFANQTDMSLHTGNKPLNTNGLKRMTEFCDFCFSSSVKAEHVIVGGHSIYFRSFFRTFLPYDVDHVSKTNKVVNAGVVAFQLMKTRSPRSDNLYMIDPKSIRVVYGGF